MTEKNIFVYKLFLSFNISDFGVFFVKIATSLPQIGHLLIPTKLPLKIEALSSPFFENLVGGSIGKL